jgi:enoyl-CoA hydratase/carnithine racemase
MLFESRHITVTVDHGTATLAFGFGGEPVNALDLSRLRELDAALQAIEGCGSAVNVLVVRSAIPAGFCAGLQVQALAGLTHPADRSSFAWYGQQVLNRLTQIDAYSVAVIEGPCLNAGFELALACDYRVCIARPGTLLGFPERYACFGGSARLRGLAGRRGAKLLVTGHTLSGRESARLGLVDVACSERRGTIELRTFLDRLETQASDPRRVRDTSGAADERRAFALRPPPAVDSSAARETVNPIPPYPDVIGVLGNDPIVEQLAANTALRGGLVLVCGERVGIFDTITSARERGFVTPLEAEQAMLRVRPADTLDGFDRAGLVFVAAGINPFRLAAAIRPRTIVCVVRPTGSGPLAPPTGLSMPFPFPRRLLRISFCEAGRIALFPDTATDPDTLATVAAWMKPLGFSSVVFPAAARLLPRAA